MRFHEFKKINEYTNPLTDIVGDLSSPFDIVKSVGDVITGNSSAGKAIEKAGQIFGSNKSKAPATPTSADISAIQDPDFKKKLQKIADALGVKSSDLLAIMKFESGVSPSKFNAAGSGAVGLIQFMPDTAAGLGTSTAALSKMSAVEQLDYVYKYYKQYIRPGATLGDLYLATFYPAAAKQDDDFIIAKKGAPGLSGLRYSQNPVLDINRNGIITAGDVRNAIRG